MQERALLRRVARALVRAEDDYARHAGIGNMDLATAALARMQTIENCIEIKERNSGWRNAPLAEPRGSQHERDCRV